MKIKCSEDNSRINEILGFVSYFKWTEIWPTLGKGINTTTDENNGLFPQIETYN